MFRKMRRFKQQLEQKECIEVLKSQPRGVLSILGEDMVFQLITGTVRRRIEFIFMERRKDIRLMQ